MSTCCGRKPWARTDAALVNACQLCRHSPTYWRGPEHVVPAPAAVEPVEAPPVSRPMSLPEPPRLPALPVGACTTGSPMCGRQPARLYPGGWRCDVHAPGASLAEVTG